MAINVPAHMFWHGDPPARLEQLAMRSFLAQGYDLTIWTYADMRGLPSGVRRANAAEILPATAIFRNRRGSLASFSDWFRYIVLSRFGGLWADTDVIALRPAADLPCTKFLVSQWEWHYRRLRPRGWKITLNNNVIFNPSPATGDLLDLARAVAERFPKGAIDWGEIGPDLLGALAKLHPGHGYAVMPTEFANPIGYWRCPHALLRPTRLPAGAWFLHCYGDMWRRAGVDRSAPFPSGGLLAELESRFP